MTNAVSYDEILNHLSWYHRIPLGGGRFTPGIFQTDPFHWELLNLPDRLDDKSFLDIGAANGLHSFEAEKRGAQRVLATAVAHGGAMPGGFLARSCQAQGDGIQHCPGPCALDRG